jgi:hypothetical protein
LRGGGKEQRRTIERYREREIVSGPLSKVARRSKGVRQEDTEYEKEQRSTRGRKRQTLDVVDKYVNKE